MSIPGHHVSQITISVKSFHVMLVRSCQSGYVRRQSSKVRSCQIRSCHVSQSGPHVSQVITHHVSLVIMSLRSCQSYHHVIMSGVYQIIKFVRSSCQVGHHVSQVMSVRPGGHDNHVRQVIMSARQ